MAQQTVV